MTKQEIGNTECQVDRWPSFTGWPICKHMSAFLGKVQRCALILGGKGLQEWVLDTRQGTSQN